MIKPGAGEVCPNSMHRIERADLILKAWLGPPRILKSMAPSSISKATAQRCPVPPGLRAGPRVADLCVTTARLAPCAMRSMTHAPHFVSDIDALMAPGIVAQGASSASPHRPCRKHCGRIQKTRSMVRTTLVLRL